MKNNYLQNYSKDWPDKFNLEQQKIKLLFGEQILDIQHIGSTSIPGTIAKPIIDLAILVDSIADILLFTTKLKTMSYSYKPEMSSAERIFFRKGSPIEYHLSICDSGHTFWLRQIMFRDYLRHNPKLVEEYNQLKITNLNRTPAEDLHDLSKSKTYNQGKGDFVAKVLGLAKKELSQKGS